MLVVPSFFKGVTINAKMRLDHELLSSPEPHILKWLGYIDLKSRVKVEILLPDKFAKSLIDNFRVSLLFNKRVRFRFGGFDAWFD
ncbi:hypothetical protein [Pseudoalteromonas sp. NBT06-2]|uniref:hypothetical protein n=1 Tax=Pseudoalteromonas sp. NBT06-2 TaxID=2025950 RepID=UPI001482FEAB|nr:hypothetical protein [Pseudoalteromonas sp. NBT06-2]